MNESELWVSPPKCFTVERYGEQVTVIHRDSWLSSIKIAALIGWFLSATFCFFACYSPWSLLLAIPSQMAMIAALVYLAKRVRAVVLAGEEARVETRWLGRVFGQTSLSLEITRVRVGRDEDTDLPEYTVDAEGLSSRLTVLKGLAKRDALWFGENLAAALGVRYLPS